ncbi:MAG: hypothetical protein GWN71_29165 [Gammaproteobacteria bacterium]|nr:hypothetical protein [Gemmatimonadota bacterium]NIU77478.1 hypothetical protein [Gammaproteobacteria bacterium]NIY11048.1 hypothetical protein [Gemmatimonadota bacterium]
MGKDRELDVYQGQRLYGVDPHARAAQIPARTTRPQTLDEARAAGGGPVPGERAMTPAPPAEVGPARGAGVQPDAMPAPVGPQAVAAQPPPGPSAVVPFTPEGHVRGPLGSGKAWTEEELERRARNFATMETAKYLPSFAMHSRLSNLTRQIVPFSSFSHEAIRVWKNALVEKPHLAYFWEHITDAMSQVSGAVAGYSPEQLEEAYANLPWYNQGKKMLAWPVSVDGKPAFIDMSYIIPLANVVEAERADTATIGHLVGLAGLDVTSNPLANIAVAGVTGRDVFKQTEIEPRITERQLGISVEQPTARQAVGLAEHIIGTMLPPLSPFGYAGQNIIEYARGQRHGQTGGPLEQGLARTIASNMLALRFNMADVQSNLLNIGYEDRKRNEATARWWERWAFAVANDRDDAALQAERNLFELQLQGGKSQEEAYKYLIDGVKTREPGAYRNYGKKRLREAIERSERLGLGEHPTDAGQLAAMRRRTRKTLVQRMREIERGPSTGPSTTQLFKLPEE